MFEYNIENNQEVVIPDNSLNMIFHLNVDNCSELKELIIGNDCCMRIGQFDLDGLNSLQSIQIGNNSFTTETNSWDIPNNKFRSFSIINCKQLESIQIGSYSFSDYAGQFQLASVI